MKIQFSKYQGTGNDFIITDDRKNELNLSRAEVAQLCDRRFGIGADGLMLLRNKEGFDFEMVYYNSDGKESTMCGNGGRCIVAFAQKIGVIKNGASFWAIDGAHKASISQNKVSLSMIKVERILEVNEDFEVYTGSPHYVKFIDYSADSISKFNEDAKAIRNNANYKKDGINVNQVFKTGENEIEMRTYERGVEDETYSCGTGAVAAAICTHHKFKGDNNAASIDINTPGGRLNVSFDFIHNVYTNIKLSGSATFVFNGEIEL